MTKQAVDAVNDFTRTRMREEGFYRRILPPVAIGNDDLDRQVDTDKPVKVVDKEANSPAAITIPFGTLPKNMYIHGPRYRVMFQRLVTPRFTKDVDELRTWVMDIRQVMSDNAIKDMLAEEDSNFINAVDTALGGSAGTLLSYNDDQAQWEEISGGITRETLADAFKIMPKAVGHWEVQTVLVNNVTIKEVLKFGRDELGGDLSEELVRKGWVLKEFMGVEWLITIKRDLVGDNTIYMFGDPKAIGKSYILEDTTMYIKNEAYMIEFFCYETIGGSIGNTSALARADFVY
jgi:hypothetical protein